MKLSMKLLYYVFIGNGIKTTAGFMTYHNENVHGILNGNGIIGNGILNGNGNSQEVIQSTNILSTTATTTATRRRRTNSINTKNTSLQSSPQSYSPNPNDREEPFFATTRISRPRPDIAREDLSNSALARVPTEQEQELEKQTQEKEKGNVNTNTDASAYDELWSNLTIEPSTVQGNSLKTYSFDSSVERIELFMKTNGRPLHAEIELWHGPHNTPQTLKVYMEDGSKRTFNVMVESPGSTNSIAFRNTGKMLYPLIAGVDIDKSALDVGPAQTLFDNSKPTIVQGGAVITRPFATSVQSVQVMLNTNGGPLNARIELFQGPDNDKQVMDVYTEDGSNRPFYTVIETPGIGNVVRVTNTASMEFPINASIEPFMEQVESRTSWSD